MRAAWFLTPGHSSLLCFRRSLLFGRRHELDRHEVGRELAGPEVGYLDPKVFREVRGEKAAEGLAVVEFGGIVEDLQGVASGVDSAGLPIDAVEAANGETPGAIVMAPEIAGELGLPRFAGAEAEVQTGRRAAVAGVTAGDLFSLGRDQFCGEGVAKGEVARFSGEIRELDLEFVREIERFAKLGGGRVVLDSEGLGRGGEEGRGERGAEQPGNEKEVPHMS